jgi:hypothetical protein
MSTREKRLKGQLALPTHPGGAATGCAIFIALASGCAAHSSPGFLEYKHHQPSVIRCRAGTIEFCTLEAVSKPAADKQELSCGCIDARVFRRPPGTLRGQRRPR